MTPNAIQRRLAVLLLAKHTDAEGQVCKLEGLKSAGHGKFKKDE